MYSYLFDSARVNSQGNSSADLVTKSCDNVQVKATTISNDLTSFGPKSTWDFLVFMDYSVQDEVTIYNIPSESIYNSKLNKKKNETFVDQQEQGRRPRLSIKKIIERDNIKPIKKVNLK